MRTLAIGADIGGSHISCAAVDLETHQLLTGTGAQMPINNKAGADEILNGWAAALARTCAAMDLTRLAGIGFAMPGPFDYPNGIALFERVEKYESLYGMNITEELRKRLGLDNDIPFRYINDATAFAIAEAWLGKASRFEKVIALTLGTGFGSAFIDKGIPVIEGNTVPAMGCVWHIPYENGIANDYFSTPWFIQNYFKRSGIAVKGVKEIADRAENDPVALTLFKEYGEKMGNFLVPWIKNFDAGVILIGGNIAGSFHLFGEEITVALSKNNLNIEVYLSDLKENAAIIGATRLLIDEYYHCIKDLLTKM
jgi:glucokinase